MFTDRRRQSRRECLVCLPTLSKLSKGTHNNNNIYNTKNNNNTKKQTLSVGLSPKAERNLATAVRNNRTFDSVGRYHEKQTLKPTTTTTTTTTTNIHHNKPLKLFVSMHVLVPQQQYSYA
jgi:hypothetical protein